MLPDVLIVGEGTEVLWPRSPVLPFSCSLVLSFSRSPVLSVSRSLGLLFSLSLCLSASLFLSADFLSLCLFFDAAERAHRWLARAPMYTPATASIIRGSPARPQHAPRGAATPLPRGQTMAARTPKDTLFSSFFG